VTETKHARDLLSISAEAGAIAEAAHHSARSSLRIADLANGLQVSIASIIAGIVDGPASINDVRSALDKSPLAQEGGAAVTAEGLAGSTAGVGNGPADREGPAHDGEAVGIPLQAGQALAGGDADRPRSNPVPASPLEEKVREIMLREGLARNAAICIWHETDASLERIAMSLNLSSTHIGTWLRNARNNGDARVLRGDDARGIPRASAD
jgi:hypothetical protein